MDEDLIAVNQCLSRYKVEMYRGEDGKHRIWGDINRIQDIVFGPCLDKFPPTARRDLDDFFATEVDDMVARCLRSKGVKAEIDLSTGVGIEITGPQPADSVMDDCFDLTYNYFSSPPDQRPEPPA